MSEEVRHLPHPSGLPSHLRCFCRQLRHATFAPEFGLVWLGYGIAASSRNGLSSTECYREGPAQVNYGMVKEHGIHVMTHVIPANYYWQELLSQDE